ncbi:zinc-finger domain-containing protein [Peribacillus deserti]|uniref:Zinc-finger domain-containing protein n=1 Tax=Peribacillus deserti TaxID=673318 RepID=A0A2N5M209_9BACI|nr:zinc-finger domain-containing protein [Peribacillus deserti]PLT28397.1 zinc-finger domain-containing protein [Peribacillus deserti]
MDRKQIFSEVDEILESYCAGCFLKSHHRKEKGKAFAHKFCISQCTVGEKLKEAGRKLSTT